MDLGLLQKEVAECLGVHPDTVKHWEKGEHRPRGEHRERLAEVLYTDDRGKTS